MEKLTINYIYDLDGKAEYAVIPFFVWQQIRQYIQQPYIEIPKKENSTFEPSSYKGIISHLNLNIEQELKDMRSTWDRNIL